VANESPFALRNSPFAKARNEPQIQSAGGGAYVFVFVTPRKTSEAKRRQTQLVFSRPLRARPRPQSAGAHLSAFHRGSGLGDRTPLPSFSSALPELVPLSGRYPRTGQPQYSDASRRPVVMPVGRTTRRCPGAGCKSARGRRTRPVLTACRPQPVRLGEVQGHK